MIDIVLPAPAQRALALLGGAGNEAYMVGGCVRDCLLHKEPYDWDIATDALPEQIIACFEPHARVIPTGLRHGTVTVILDGMQLEVTTYRVDGDYTDARRPDSVRFTRSIREDLARRDFTINAMAYHPERGIADPFGGQADALAGIIRCVGDPDARLGEDALRILRALRFMSQHAFTIEEATSRSLLRSRELLRRISAERVASELGRLLCGKGVGDVLRQYHVIFEVFMPELAPMVGFKQRNPYHMYDVFEHTVRVVENVIPRAEVRLAALLHDCGKPDCFSIDERGVGHFYGHPQHSHRHASDILARLKYDNHTKHIVATLIENHDAYIPPEERAVRRWLSKLGAERLDLLFELKKGDCIGQGVAPERVKDIEAAQRLAHEIVARGECLSVRELSVSGKDLLAIGAPAGPLVGRLLAALLGEVLEGQLPNRHEDLAARAHELLSAPEFYQSFR